VRKMNWRTGVAMLLIYFAGLVSGYFLHGWLGSFSSSRNRITVSVSGAVEHPGIFHLPAGSRVLDAVQKAGGYTIDADVEAVNPTDPLVDGQNLFIPTRKGGTSPAALDSLISQSQSQPPGSTSGLININTASQSELEKLPNIGPAKARAIIEYREKNGKFRRIEEIKNVKGIGQKIFEKIKDLITVG